MTEHQAPTERNWLQAYLVESIRKKWCVSIYCTTCGAHEFRNGLLDAVARATDQPRPRLLDGKSARAIAEALARVEPVQSSTDPDHEVTNSPAYFEAVRLVISDLWATLTPLDEILGHTWAANELESMRSHERGVVSSRASRAEYESPELVALRREEKRQQRRVLHEQRLALKEERDRRWRLAHPEAPPPRNPE